MASAVEGNVDDPHAQYRIGRDIYLVVLKNRYGISRKPRNIPKDVVVIARASETKGLRRFEVHRKEIPDEYDVVTVGTFKVEHGYAYVAGHYIPGEEPHDSYEIVWIPPFKVTYPYEFPEGKEYYVKFMLKVRADLVKIIREYNQRKLCVTDNFHFCRDYDIDQPNRCENCLKEKYDGGSDLCDNCEKGHQLGKQLDNCDLNK